MTIDKTPGQNLTFWKLVLNDPFHPMRAKILPGRPEKERTDYIQKMIIKIELEDIKQEEI
jgi:menaquinone-dependent protoporphyrinogen IX oxidase